MGTGYSLGVDLGNTYVAAAVGRGSEIEMCTLGESSLVMPAVVHIGDDGTTTVGEPAVRRGLAHPERLVRGLRRRLGDRAPVVVDGRAHTVPELLAALLREVLAKVIEQQGAPPERVVLARPATWDPARRAAFAEVARLAGLNDARSVSEPEAVAAQYSATRGFDDGRVLAVYDLGGGTFEVSLVRKLRGGVEIVGEPQGIERLGGLDFDEALVDLVDGSLGGRVSGVDPGDPGAVRFLSRLRGQCEHAKEALTSDDMIEIPVSVGVEQFDARITRADLESLVGPHVESTVLSVKAALNSAGMSAGQLDGILLVGGSSRIPLVARMLTSALGCPVRTNVSAKNLVALGAAASVGVPLGASVPTPPPTPPPAPPPAPPLPPAPRPAMPMPMPPPLPAIHTPPAPLPPMPAPPAAPRPPMPVPPSAPPLAMPSPPGVPSPPAQASGQPYQPQLGTPQHWPTPGVLAPTAKPQVQQPVLQPPEANRHQEASFEVRRFVVLLVLVAVLAAAGLVAFALATGLRP